MGGRGCGEGEWGGGAGREGESDIPLVTSRSHYIFEFFISWSDIHTESEKDVMYVYLFTENNSYVQIYIYMYSS